MHQLRLFPKKKYLSFKNTQPINLDNSNGSNLKEEIYKFFKERKITIQRSNHKWRLIFITNKGTLWGSLHPNDEDLYKYP